MKKIVCWWSGGITSSVACKIAIDFYGVDNCRVIMIDTQNEHEDTYRFKADCEKWYGSEIEIITGIGEKYGNIFDVWRKHKSLNTATGAICSTNLKRLVREKLYLESIIDDMKFKEFMREFIIGMALFIAGISILLFCFVFYGR